VPTLKLTDGGEACLELRTFVADGGKVFVAEFELAGADSDEVGGRSRVAWWRVGTRNVARVMSKGRRRSTPRAM
jgi:hypothetical protein